MLPAHNSLYYLEHQNSQIMQNFNNQNKATVRINAGNNFMGDRSGYYNQSGLNMSNITKNSYMKGAMNNQSNYND